MLLACSVLLIFTNGVSFTLQNSRFVKRMITFATTTKANEAPIIGANLYDIVEDSLEEVTTPKRLKVVGEIPSYVKGSLIRNGPGLFSSPSTGRKYTHIFDGLAKLSSYRFDGQGNVEFLYKFIRSPLYNRVVKEKKDLPAITALAPLDPPVGLLTGLFTTLTAGLKYGNTNVNLHQLGGSGPMLAVTDAPLFFEIDPPSLETTGAYRFPSPIVTEGTEMLCTAHPHSQGGFSYNIFTEYLPWKGGCRLLLVRMNSAGEREVIGQVETDFIPYTHDFSLTENYAVLCVWSVQAPPLSFLNGGGFLPQLQFNATRPTSIHLFSLHSSSAAPPVKTFQTTPLFAYHHLGAYEQEREGGGEGGGRGGEGGGKEVVLEVVAYPNAKIANGPNAFLYLPNMKDPRQVAKQERTGKCHRWTLPLSPSSSPSPPSSSTPFLSPQLIRAIDEQGQEFEYELVSLGSRERGGRIRFSYGMTGHAGRGPTGGGYREWGVVKLNHFPLPGSPSCQVWSAPSLYPTEPIFVPSPHCEEGGKGDEGVLLVQCYDGLRRESCLVVLDGESMEERARAYTGQRIPLSFHGIFLPGQ